MSIKEIMAAHIDPSGDFLFQSVQVIADNAGTRTKAPTTDAEWAEVRHHLDVLIEAQAFLADEGRKAAPAGFRTPFPEVELQPEEIEAKVAADRQHFAARAEDLKTAAMGGLQAVESRDKDALSKSLLDIDHACELCHLEYWYPKDERAKAAAREEGLLP